MGKEKGLTSQQAREHLAKFGPNQLAEAKKFSSFKLLASQFKSPLIYILVLAGIVTLFLNDLTDSIVIFAAVLINTILGFYQEQKAQKALAALNQLLSPKAKVIRDGQQQEIDASQVVPDDVVVLTIGSRVPADGILLEAKDLSINEAILTGESMPVSKKQEDKAFMGTLVVTGIAKMMVVRTGMQTEMGKIGKQVQETKEEKTPLQVQLAKLAKLLAILVAVITVLIFLTGELLGYEPLEMFTISVAVAVAAIPEGLVVTLTVILALGMQRILKRKAIVRKLLAAETLGSVSVICADKTGTLTEGIMQVVKADFTDLKLGQKAAFLCNDMRDPLEVAMMAWVKEKLNKKEINKLKKEYPRLDEKPFSPDTKLIATLHRASSGVGQALLFVSGAPEVLLAKSKLTSVEEKNWQAKFNDYGKQGYRLVGFAYKKVIGTSKIKNSDLEKLSWLGILIYEDPVRQTVKSALEEAQKAGIKIKVITGDYLPTALAVLHKLGLNVDKASLTGDQLNNLSPVDLQKKVKDIVLFARTNPEQKLKIVQALKANGEVVAMTGDGVNDAPAIKMADIGIVVNDASDVAKQTADMVLLDSNFSTIIHAVEEGRMIFENIKKVVLYLLSDSFTEIILVGGSIVLGLPLPVTAAQILWVNLVEDALPGIALAFEPKEKSLMAEPPRPKAASILDTELKVLIFIIGLSLNFVLLGLFYWLNQGFLHLHYIQTVMFVALAVDSLFIVFACRSLRQPIFTYNPFANKALTGSTLIGLLMLLAAVYLPSLQRLLKTHGLGWQEWFFLLGLGLFSLLAVEVTKWVFIIRHKKQNVKITS